MNKNDFLAMVRAFATVIWFGRWALAFLAYVLAVTPSHWGWFSMTP